ncbi:hypothetical protein DY000_02037797 [Brassica cretica]|uniref:Uncharacterized protein n=1 Tax=Brassica cretica TaxID=69181 RepID=A0ABQ7BQY2_BRACR|nr:hypothetical protein DY000_02037797 [Brassica cretica]
MDHQIDKRRELELIESRAGTDHCLRSSSRERSQREASCYRVASSRLRSCLANRLRSRAENGLRSRADGRITNRNRLSIGFRVRDRR